MNASTSMEQSFQKFYNSKRAELRAKTFSSIDHGSDATKKPAIASQSMRFSTILSVSSEPLAVASLAQSEISLPDKLLVPNEDFLPSLSEELLRPSQADPGITLEKDDANPLPEVSAGGNQTSAKDLTNEDNTSGRVEDDGDSSDDVPLRALAKKRRLNADAATVPHMQSLRSGMKSKTTQTVLPSPFADRPITIKRAQKNSGSVQSGLSEPQPRTLSEIGAHQQ